MPRQALLDDHDLGPRDAVAHEPRVALVVAAPGRPLDGVLADPAGAQHRDADGVALGRREGRPAPLEGVEGRGQPVAGHVAQVLDEAPSVVAGDHVERDGLDAQAAQQLDAFRPRGEVEHREQDRAGTEQLVASLGRPQHHHDVLAIRRGLVDDADPRRLGQVAIVGVPMPAPLPASTYTSTSRLASRPISDGRNARRSPGSLYMRGKADREPAVVGHLLPLSSGFLGCRVREVVDAATDRQSAAASAPSRPEGPLPGGPSASPPTCQAPARARRRRSLGPSGPSGRARQQLLAPAGRPTLRGDRAQSSPGWRCVALGRAGGSGCLLDMSRSGSRGCTGRPASGATSCRR